MLNDDMKQLIIFAAPSGSGKSSLISKIIEQSDNKVQLSVSATTREPRDGEVHGVDYFFISEQEFLKLEKQDAFWVYKLNNDVKLPNHLKVELE